MSGSPCSVGVLLSTVELASDRGNQLFGVAVPAMPQAGLDGSGPALRVGGEPGGAELVDADRVGAESAHRARPLH